MFSMFGQTMAILGVFPKRDDQKAKPQTFVVVFAAPAAGVVVFDQILIVVIDQDLKNGRITAS